MRPISRGALPARPGVAGRLGDRLPGGGVDDHDGAVGEMRDPVGDVAEQETLSPPHPRAADDDDVGVRALGRLEDHGGDVVPRLDHGAGADPLGRQRALERRRETRALGVGSAGARRVGRLGDVGRAAVVTRGVDLGGLGSGAITWIASRSASSERAKVAAHSTASAAPALPSVATATSLVSGGTGRGYGGARASAVSWPRFQIVTGTLMPATPDVVVEQTNYSPQACLRSPVFWGVVVGDPRRLHRLHFGGWTAQPSMRSG